MLGGFRRLIGTIKVTATDRLIEVSGIPGDIMQRDILRIWKTSKVNEWMFSDFGKNSFSFNPFFAPEIVYILDTLVSTKRSRFTSTRVLTNLRDALEEHTWLKNTKPDADAPERLNLKNLSRLKYTPLPFQQRFLETYSTLVTAYGLRGYLLAAAAGSGKTFTCCAVAECLDVDHVLVACPLNATERVWEKDGMLKLFKETPTYWIEAQGHEYRGEKYLIVHFESLGKIQHIAEMLRKEGKSVMVILDESHFLNELTSQRTQNFLEVDRMVDSQDTLWASGTPIKALGSECIPMLRSIDPRFNADAEMRFKKIYGSSANKGLDILKHRMGLISYKVEKSELKLADPIMKILPVTIPNGDAFTLESIKGLMQKFILERSRYYEGCRKEDEAFWKQCLSVHEASLKSTAARKGFSEYLRVLNIVVRTADPRYIGEEIRFCNVYEKKVFQPTLPREMVERFKETKTIIKYVSLKIQGECLGRVLGRARIECHVAMVPHVDFVGVCDSTTKKTVVFTSFVEALEAMDRHCSTVGLNPLTVYGKTNNELANTVARFESDVHINPLLATFNSLSTAVPLVMADNMIMLNDPFRAYINEQAISRIHRIGATTQTVVWKVRLDTGDRPNISTRSADILAWSQEMVEAIMGIKSPFAEGVAVEAFDDEQELDENRLMHRHVQALFDGTDIMISQEDFMPQVVCAPRVSVPAYLSNW
jgi:hypothetical protein